MRLVFVNPNASAAMTDGIVATARWALPEADTIGLAIDEGGADTRAKLTEGLRGQSVGLSSKGRCLHKHRPSCPSML